MARRTARDLRNENRFEVLHALFERGPSTRQELTRHTGLSAATVATVVTEFVVEEVLEIATVEKNTVGRPYERLAINPVRGRIVGVDVAETYVDATVFDMALGVMGHAEVALDEYKNDPEYVVDGITRVVRAALDDAGITDPETLLGAGVSLPGHVHPDAGVSVFAPNWDWNDVRIEELLEAGLGIPVYVDNPLKAIAVAELWFGAGRAADSLAVVNLGTGVGAGVAIERSLIRGAANNAGEWGHTLLQLDGRPCRCGRRGCVEAYLGVHGLQITLADIAPEHPALRTTGQSEFVQAVAAGLASGEPDPDLATLVDRTAHYLAAALGDLVNLLDIPRLTLTGWTTRALAPWLVPAVRAELPAHVLPGSRADVTVAASEVPGNPVAVGMAAFALERFLVTLGLAGPASSRPVRRRAADR
ncbi:ROK family protein [Streptomyces sp. VRA16 Mangrove soil]|uniref:ROK family protein n=1 Tax=Streptomyces sp. VRA16 Mangrove soil TaxID=2817434 RepID=UPI001A9F92AD|nr:ROK family protein [Streptomyces sp. VRA16 Mangrove soil]MBO1330700.1 ROK family protein [Streptomyces sp. VRA16 Mangrove soil]